MQFFKTLTITLFITTALLSGCNVEKESQQEQAVANPVEPTPEEMSVEPAPGETNAQTSATFEESTSSQAGRSGKEIYNKSCTTCHAAGVANAPRLGDVAAWNERLAKGMDTLYLNAKNGLNAMPPKGLCMDCTDEELNAAVDYLIAGSK
jgi:cytochrome c5